VNVEQQRRLDLIPNLVATVKGYVKEESTVLTNIANARAGVLGAPDKASSINANTKLDVALGPFFRLQEQYPDLKSNQQFMRLSDELAGTENRIATARKRYNRYARRLQHVRAAVSEQLLGRDCGLQVSG
jgi:LemA protein